MGATKIVIFLIGWSILFIFTGNYILHFFNIYPGENEEGYQCRVVERLGGCDIYGPDNVSCSSFPCDFKEYGDSVKCQKNAICWEPKDYITRLLICSIFIQIVLIVGMVIFLIRSTRVLNKQKVSSKVRFKEQL